MGIRLTAIVGVLILLSIQTVYSGESVDKVVLEKKCGRILSFHDMVDEDKTDRQKASVRKQVEFVNKYFGDLSSPELSEFLVERINHAASIRDKKVSGIDLAACICLIKPTEFFQWVIKNYGQLTPSGLYNLLIAAKYWKEYKEPYEFIVVWLADKRQIPVYGEFAAVSSRRFRVCDIAQTTMIFMSIGWADPKEFGLDYCDIDATNDERDQQIDRFLEWWKKNSERVLKDKKQMFDAGSEFEDKLKKIRKHIEKEEAKRKK